MLSQSQYFLPKYLVLESSNERMKAVVYKSVILSAYGKNDFLMGVRQKRRTIRRTKRLEKA